MQMDDNLIFGKVYTFIRCLNAEKNTYQQSAFPRFQIVCAFSFTIYTINSTFNDNIALKRKVISLFFLHLYGHGSGWLCWQNINRLWILGFIQLLFTWKTFSKSFKKPLQEKELLFIFFYYYKFMCVYM